MALVGSLSGSGGSSNTINVTGSMIIANPGTGGLFPAFPGTDTVFFVSGAIDGKAAGSRTVSVFGGDVVASGSITIGTGSIRIDSNEIRFQGGAAKITSGSGGLTFFDSGNAGGVTLSALAAGAGGGDVVGPGSATDNAIARFETTTGKLIQDSPVTISDLVGGTTVSMVGDVTATTVNLFNTNATTVNFAGGASTSLSIGPSGGTTTIAGDLQVTGNDIKNSVGTTTITMTSEGNVVIPGDLTVQGTTVTVDATTLTIEDPVIGLGFTSGSTAVAAGDRGFIGGISGADNVALIWDNTDSTFTSARTTTGAGNDPVAITSYTPFRASSFQIGGTPGSAVAAGSAFLSSSDALNVLVNHTSTTTFTKAGTPIVQVGDYAGSGEGQIKGVTTANALAPLWLSGSAINVGSPTVSFLINDTQQATIKPQTGGAGVRFEGQDGTGTSRAMVISGSQTTIGANSRLVVLEGAGVPFLTASSNAAFNTVSLTPGAGFTTANIAHDVATTVNFAAGGSIARTVNLGTGAAAQTVTVGSTNSTSALTLQAGSGATTHTAGGTYDVNAAGAITIDSSGGTIGIGTDAVAQDINVGTGAAARTITIGNATGATSVVLNAGTGNINIGTGAQARTVNLGTGLAAQTVTVGSADSTSALALKAGSGKINVFQDILPNTDNAFDLGSPSKRFRNMFTGDLHLRNERGDWTIIEEEDYLSITNNKNGKRYKFMLQEI